MCMTAPFFMSSPRVFLDLKPNIETYLKNLKDVHKIIE